MFDVTSRFIEHSDINESHVYASLYNCKTVGSDIKCTQTFGFIINDNNGYSRCSSDGCKYISNINEIPTSCEVVGNGGIIKDGNTLKFCNSVSSMDIASVQSDYYPININIEGSFPETSFGNNVFK